MKIIKLLLLFTFGLWADFKLDIPNENEEFYKEVASVFVQPLYRPINTSRFEDMNGTEMSFEMKESIEAFLPIYLSTKSPLCKNHENYPTTEIQRFFKVLNKYMDFLEFEHRDKEIYEILDKRLSDAYDCIQNASSLLDLLFGMSYYEKILYVTKCNDRTSRVLIRKKCDNTQMRTLLEKYNVPKAEHFFDALEEDRKQNVNTMLAAIKEEGISQKNLEVFSEEFTKHTQNYYMKYSKKLRDTVNDDSHEALDDYKNYINMEFESIQSVETITKTILSHLSLEIQKLLSLDNKHYGYIIDYRVKTMTLLIFTGLGGNYARYQKFLKNYDELLKSCPHND